MAPYADADEGGFTDTFTTAARSLALPIDDPDDEPILPTRRSTEQSWRRHSLSDSISSRPRNKGDGWYRWWVRFWFRLTPLQKAGLIALDIVLIVATVLFLVYSHKIFAWLSPIAKSWRELNGGWLILWWATVLVAFPPMVGYSTCVTIGGFVYGMKGWLIIATANVVGSTISFIVSRTLLHNFVRNLSAKNKEFAALSLVLKHDGLKLLVMIRLCPLPYSLSNGAISTIPTVTWWNFALATAIASPKLLLHIFVGSRLGDLAENGDKMDTKTKIVSYVSIVFGIVAGILTGYLVYVRTRARARQLEAEEAEAAVSGRRRSSTGAEYIDDPDEQAAVDFLRQGEDDISLHTAADGYADDLEGGRYRDEFTDDEDAVERDVFDDGDGFGEAEDGERKKGER
jgi:uncharacterized membrane protein YdjX (TVP38/TMEM64 family)